MSKYVEKAKRFRTVVEPNYNCAQSVAVAFAEDAGVPEELVLNISANFGAGMRMDSVCGAFTGGLIALGLFGLTEPAVVKAFAEKIKENHHGTLICAELLRINKEQGGEKKPHCDALICECTQAVEDLLREYGKIL